MRGLIWRRCIAAVPVLVLVGACMSPAPVLTGISTRSGGTLTVVIDDRVSWVRGFEFVRADLGPMVNGVDLSNPAGRPDVVRVGWYSGRCDHTATVAIDHTAGERLRLTVTSRPECAEQVAVDRTIDVVFDRDVPAASIDGFDTDWATPPP